MKDQIMEILKNRNFWLGLAAFLGTVGASLIGAFTGNQTFLIIGSVCGAVSVGIYSALKATAYLSKDKEGGENED